MRWFYDRYSPLFENLRQLAVELFSIPWGHHQIIIGKCPSLEEFVSRHYRDFRADLVGTLS